MRILIIGGTRLVGRHIAMTAIDRGHDVTVFNRGQTDPAGLPGATQLTGDRNTDLSALLTGEWDATIDVCAYGHLQVRHLFEALGDRGGHVTFISTISVYAPDVPAAGFTEDAALLEPEWDDSAGMERYGELKVACEEVAASYTDGQLLIVRPGYVVGPYDYTERFTHWIRAVAAGQPFAAPAAEQPLQVVDGRDLAAFTVAGVERSLTGAFNVAAPSDPPTFTTVLQTIASALQLPLPQVTWGDPHDETIDLPLAESSDWWPLMRADVSKAVAEGLSWRSLADTVRDTAAFVGLPTPPAT